MKNIYIISTSANLIDEKSSQTSNIEKQVNTATSILNNLWLNIVFWDLYNKKYNWYAWNIEERVKEIETWFKSKEIDFILSLHGWYNSNDLIRHLDYELIKSNPKPIIGLSDTSILLNAIFTKTWLITYHWYDFLWQIWLSAKDFSIEQLDNFLNKKILNDEIKADLVLNKWDWEWILIWWCIPSYSLILWTEYDPINLDKNFIFFIEDIWEDYERIISYISQLLNFPKFRKNCKWFILWNFAFCKYSNTTINKDIYDLINEKLLELNIPVLKIEKIGHVVENYILPIWKKVKISNNTLYLN